MPTNDKFPVTLKLEHTEHRFKRRVLEDFIYTRNKMVVPEGFVTDLASIQPLRFILPAMYALLSGYGDRAAVVHDYLYCRRGYIFVGSGNIAGNESCGEYSCSPFVSVSRKRADQIFKQALRDEGVARWRAAIFYYGVRAFGWSAWRRNRARAI